jgi:CRISP-associated protein Cas1
MIKRTLYFSSPAYLSLQNNQMLLKLPEVVSNGNLPEILKKEAQTSFPIEDIGLLILDNQRITLTQGLVEKLITNNVSLLWCDSSHMPTAITLPLSHNDTYTEKVRYQIEATEPLKKQLWKQTVEAKIKNQAKTIKILGYNGLTLEKMAEKVNSGDPENIEGRAAARYWEILLKPFGVSRGQEEGPPNNLLNYGYAILRAIIARSLVASGCLPVMGIHHRNKYNAYCLADDIMEPYRPIVDLLVFQYLQKSGTIPEFLEKEHKAELFQIPVMDIWLEGKQSPLMVGSQRTTASLMKCFMGEARKILYPEIKLD